MEKLLLMKGQFNEIQITEPLGISLLASIVRTKCFCDTIIYDPQIEGDDVEIAVEKVIDIKPKVLGISAIELDRNCVIEFVTKLRKKDPNIIIVIGGYGPTLSTELFLVNEVNLLFIGESELSFPMFINKVLRNEDFHNIPGIAYRNKKGEIIINQPYPRIQDLDSLPLISRDILREIQKKYIGHNSAQLISSRGCYMNCGYCSVKAFSAIQNGLIYRERSVENVISEIKYLYDNFGIRFFYFEDDNFIPRNIDKAIKKINGFYKLLKELNYKDLSFYLQCRPDNLQIDLIKLLRDVGLKEVFLGIESINKQDLKLYNRITNIENVYANLKDLNKMGFSCKRESKLRLHIGYIMFNPYSTRELLRNSLHFFKEFSVSPKKLISHLKPFRNTLIYEKLKSENLIDENDNIIFKENEVAEIFKYSQEIVKEILTFREQLRSICKGNNILSNTCIKELDNIRKKLDDLCFEAFEQLIVQQISNYENIKKIYFKLAADLKSTITSKFANIL